MENKLIINTIKKDKNKISYKYNISGEWKKYFNSKESFKVEYDMDIDTLPDSVAVLPFLGNILVMASVFNATIFINSIDKDFMNAIPDILLGYQNMYPHITFNITDIIKSNAITENTKLNSGGGERILFFSGGVDAYSSLISHEKENLRLVSVLGADIPVNNIDAWNIVCTANREIANKHHASFSSIKANLHDFINEYEIDKWSRKNAGDNWWYCFQHSIGMLTLSAPLAYTTECSIIYFASTYCNRDPKGYALASDPSIDNHIRFCGTSVVHDGFEFSRQDKIHRICKYSSNKQIRLRVCFKSSNGDNCCICRKCLLTVFQILLEDENPEDYGFHYDKTSYIRLLVSGMQELAHEHPFDFKSLFSDMQIKFREKYDIKDVPLELKPFYILSIDEFIAFMSVPNSKEKELKELKEWSNELEQGKHWLEQQFQYKDARIKELENWITELEKGKKWLEKQVQYKNECIKELKKLNI